MHHVSLNKVGLIAVFLLFFMSSANAAPIQWSAAAGGNDHWYEFVADSSMSWAGSFSSAASRGGYLVTITSAEENNFVFQLALDSSVASYLSYFWLGGSDEEIEGTWKWMDGPEAGQNFTYSNFAPGEPNDYWSEDYLTMLVFGTQYPSHHGTWNDFAGSLIWPDWNQLGYVVEYDEDYGANPVPEPSTAFLLGIGLAGIAFAGRKGRKAEM